MSLLIRRSLCRWPGSADVFQKLFAQDVWHGNATVRCLSTTELLFKRRKTAEERKTPNLIEYSPKKSSNKPTLHGVADIWRYITVQELANVLKRPIEDIQEAMLYVKDADDIDPSARLEDIKVIREIVAKCGMKSRIVAAPEKDVQEEKDKDVTPRPPAPPEKLQYRPPVVTVMGHVDHGKTTLLDSLRGASVAAGEAGGITQHIGAFTVTLSTGEAVTFLDTPGHAAFSAMRSRGADITDIIILVVAADDGVMAQTREVIKLAQEANVPIIVAINKVDKPEADVERAKSELAQMGLALEGLGGDTQVVAISALKGTNLKELTEAVVTQATLMGLKAEYTGLVEGVVVESKNDKHRGKLSTAIVTRGTLRKGSVVVSGLAWAKVRGLFDHVGSPVDDATPGTPVEIIGWRDLPLAGNLILEVESERKAHSVMKCRELLEQRDKALRDKDAINKKEQEHLEKYIADRDARRRAGRFKMRPDGPRTKLYEEDPTPRVNVILKGDVHGSVEAILDVFDSYTEHDKCRLNVIHYGVGDVTEGDMELSRTFKAVIYAFSVNAPTKTPKHVTIREFNIIYRLIDDLKEEISKKLPQVEVEDLVGEANVLQRFLITEGKKEVPVAGCRCTKGVLKKNSSFRLVRNGEVIYEGPVDSIRHLKNEVESIKKDVECGIRLKDTKVLPEPGDTLVCFASHTEPQTTSWDPGF